MVLEETNVSICQIDLALIKYRFSLIKYSPKILYGFRGN